MKTEKEYQQELRQYKADLRHFNEKVKNDPKLGPMAKSWLLPQEPVPPGGYPLPTDAMDKELSLALGPHKSRRGKRSSAKAVK